MAPEQARGKAVDSRADIWAFGVILYELMTGERPFKGDDLTETLAAVVKDLPDLNAVPARVRPLLDTCLQKDPRKRLQSIGDAGLLLRPDVGSSSAPPRPGRFDRAVPIGSCAIALIAASRWRRWRSSTSARCRRCSGAYCGCPFPSRVVARSDFSNCLPDGTRLALVTSVEGRSQLFVRSLDSDGLQPLAGTANARTPFWSADSRFIGFFADGKLKTIPAGGGPIRELCTDAGLGGGGTWNRDGVILWAGGPRYIRRVNASGGDCRPLGTRDPAFTAIFPTFHPDGNHFFYVGGKAQDSTSNGVYLATLDDPVGRRVLDDESAVIYTAPAVHGGRAHLLFLRDRTLMAQPFDDANMKVVGDSFPVVTGASFTWTAPQPAASAASDDGTLVYLAGRSRDSQLTWFDRGGAQLGTVGPVVVQSGVWLSPDGNMAATMRREPNDTVALWVHDLARGAATRLTPTGTTSGVPAWSPDSRRILFGATTAG
jgi:hypothetical protein